MSQIVETWAEYKGSRYNATYNEGTHLWDVDIPSGAESSYGQPNHTYPITLHAKNATYTLEYTYEIPPETLMYNVRVKVT